MYRQRNSNALTMALFLICGIVVGGFLGNLIVYIANATGVHWLDWMLFGREIGFTEPMKLDLGIIVLQLGFLIKFTISGVLGAIGAFFIHRAIR